jgi:hypothetical protein
MAKNRRLSAQAQARLRNRGGQFARQTGASFFRVDDIMRDVTDQVSKDLADKLTFWANNIKTNAERRAGLREVNSTIARETMSFVINAYENRGSEGTPAYRYEDPDDGPPRQFKRYSNGAMLRALSDPNNYTFSPREFSFINFEIMDSHAKQWYRLNFGTKDRPGDSPSGPNMKFMGVETSRKITLDQWKPSDYVAMPKGFWSKTFAAQTEGTLLKRGRGAFYPATLNPESGAAKPVNFRKVKGIEGKHFLDQGAIFINKRYPELLENMVEDWMKRGL